MSKQSPNVTPTGTEVRQIPLDDVVYQRIRKDGMFHFQEEFFSVELPASMQGSGWLSLIRDRREGGSKDNPIEQPEDWHILEIQLDGVEYPSFFGLRRAGKLPGELNQALIDFAIQRASGNQPVAPHLTSRLRKLLTDLVGLDPSPTDQDQVGHVIRGFLRDTLTHTPNTVLESFLTAQGIPIQREIDTYLFSAKESGLIWNARFILDEDADILTLVSTADLSFDAGKTADYLSDINALNGQERFGFFRLLPGEAPKLEFVSSMPLSLIAFVPDTLSKLLNRNMDAMQAACTAFGKKNAR